MKLQRQQVIKSIEPCYIKITLYPEFPIRKVVVGKGEESEVSSELYRDLAEYQVFSKVFDEQRKQYPEEQRKAVQETIRICKEKNILADYLTKEEAAVVMYNFADQEREFKKALEEEYLQGKAEERENTRKERERADKAEQRADKAEQRVEEERQRADQLEKQLREVKMKLEELNKR